MAVTGARDHLATWIGEFSKGSSGLGLQVNMVVGETTLQDRLVKPHFRTEIQKAWRRDNQPNPRCSLSFSLRHNSEEAGR